MRIDLHDHETVTISTGSTKTSWIAVAHSGNLMEHPFTHSMVISRQEASLLANALLFAVRDPEHFGEASVGYSLEDDATPLSVHEVEINHLKKYLQEAKESARDESIVAKSMFNSIEKIYEIVNAWKDSEKEESVAIEEIQEIVDPYFYEPDV